MYKVELEAIAKLPHYILSTMQAWEDFLNKQEALLGKQVIEQWLRPLKIVHFDSGNLYLEAKDSFQVLWFEEHIRPLLKSQLLNNNFRSVKVHMTVSETTPTLKPSHKEKGKSNPPITFTFDPLDPSMTMENFVPGEANRLIFHLFSELMGTQPNFNPIYLWGGSGCGKTHLLIALAHVFRKKGLNALYARAETFTEHVIAAIRSSEMQAFRKAYRHVDVLLVDDVHLFARKDATQEEFFHTFNTLHTSNRQIILSSKCAPAFLEEIAPRLVSRFEWGISVHFEKLSGKDLKNVLEKRCLELNFPLREDVLEDLVHLFPGSKSLNRALDALALRCHLNSNATHKRNSKTIDKQTVHKILSDLIAEEQKAALSPEKIISAVSAVYGIRSEDLLGKSQNQECSLPRQVAMYLCRQELKLPFQGIARLFDRDHSTVMTSIKQIQKKIDESDPHLRTSLVEVKEKIE